MNSIKEKSMKHFNKTANTYDESTDGKFVYSMYQPLMKELSKHTKGRLLDVGCGNGNLLSALLHTDHELYGIDLSENMINESKKRLNSKVKLCIADSESLPFEDDYFDILVCNASFHHYPHPDVVLEEMHRVMRSGALLFIGEGYAIEPFRFLLNLSFHFSTSGDFHSYGKREIKSMLSNHGFRAIEIKGTGNHTMLINATI